MNYNEEYLRWCEMATEDQNLVTELKNMNEKQKEDAFYRNLSFGTGGLRGVIGAGTNRINIYTIAKASQGLSNYLMKAFKHPSVVIGYDSRIKSDVFAKVSATVFAMNGIKVFLWTELNPVPTVSFATRYLHSSAGVMITASHNPSKYNGYKVYGEDGCQITTEAAADILKEIEKVDPFSDVKRMNFNKALLCGAIEYIKDKVFDSYMEEVKKQSVLFGEEIDKNVSIVYSPLNGTGYVPITRILRETGYSNVTVVEEQKLPDGNFPTCPYPNPEVREALDLGVEYCKKTNADLMLATDPDCDRVGIAVRNENGEYVLLSGNETGMLLLDYICSQRIKHGKMPNNPVLIKTIVTTDMGERIAASYGVKTRNVLTGFKFIGEQIGILEKQGKEDSYIFGFEESYGYLSGAYVRDKDAVNGAFLICEMFSYYKTRGISLLEKMNELYGKYGYCLNTLHSYEFEGASGFIKMQQIMKKFREKVQVNGLVASKKVKIVEDYSEGLHGLPKSDVIKYILQDGCSVVVRPSGTEPKLKVYMSISAETKDIAIEIEKNIINEIQKMVG